MAASVTIDHGAFSDDRFVLLGELAGFNRYEAIGRMACLWSICTELGDDRPPIERIRAALGLKGPEAILGSGLGEGFPDGSIRVRGCVGRTEWFGRLPSQQAAAGKQRVKGAKRGPDGRLLPASALAPADSSAPALTTQRSPSGRRAKRGSMVGAGASAPAHAQRNPASESEPTQNRRVAEDRTGGLRPSGDPDPGGEPRVEREQAGREADAARARAAAIAPPAVVPSPELLARRELGTRAWDRLNARRRALALELGLAEPQHLHDQLPGRLALAERLRESGARSEQHLEHVFAIAEAQARGDRSLQFFAGSLFEPKSWARKLAMDPGDVRAAPPPPVTDAFAVIDEVTAAMEEAQRQRQRDIERADEVEKEDDPT